MLDACIKGYIDEAYKTLNYLWGLGYAAEDIIGIIFRVCKIHPMAEFLKLEYIKVQIKVTSCFTSFSKYSRRQYTCY